jgi:hypothetical protein
MAIYCIFSQRPPHNASTIGDRNGHKLTAHNSLRRTSCLSQSYIREQFIIPSREGVENISVRERDAVEFADDSCGDPEFIAER